MTIRLVAEGDAPELARLRRENADFLAPFEPSGRAQLQTDEGQLAAIDHLLAEHEAGRTVPFVICAEGGVVGQLTLNDIVRGAFENAHVGYWLAEPFTGRGLVTDAVHAAAAHAFEDLGLHRLQAATLPDNVASQAVLERSSFTRIGEARRYLHIAGEWRDHVLFERLAED